MTTQNQEKSSNQKKVVKKIRGRKDIAEENKKTRGTKTTIKTLGKKSKKNVKPMGRTGVSAPETKSKQGNKKGVVFPTKETEKVLSKTEQRMAERARSDEEKRQARMQVAFDMLEDFSAAILELKQFKGFDKDHLKFACSLSLPEFQEISRQEYAEKYGFNRTTLSKRLFRDDVVEVKEYVLKAYFRSKTPKVLQTLYEGASERNVFGGTNTAAIKLWLQYLEGLTEKVQNDVNVNGGLNISFGNMNPSPFSQGANEAEAEKAKPKKTVKKKTVKKK